MTRRAMLLPSSERYSTVTSAPAASLPWILVWPSTRNWTVFTPWSVLTVRRILDLPRGHLPRQRLFVRDRLQVNRRRVDGEGRVPGGHGETNHKQGG